MRDDPLSGLSAFVAVATKRSFTAAGAELGVTPSAVSQQIQKLEERLGVRLLQRTTRSVGLTEAGERFLSRVQPALADLGDAVEGLSELRDRPAGLLRLSVPRIASTLILEPVLAPFLARYPEIRLEISVDDALANVVEGGFDAGIRLNETLDPGMVAVRITHDLRMAVVASPSYLAARGTPEHPRDLARHDCIRYRQITSGVIARWDLDEGGRAVEVAVDGRVVVNDPGLLVRAALDGLGLAYIFDDCVADELASGRLVRLLDAFCSPFPGFSLYYPSRAHTPLKLQVLVDFLRQRLRGASRTSSTG
jgi:DNA-binding transcriptional LysR family regulator